MTETADKQQFAFQAEIAQLLHILSHSLYQNREIALRELVSNASDSLNKLRHIQLTEEQYRDDAPLEITLIPNKDERTLTIQDNGIGLTHDELVQNLGTIAHSGSKEFLSKLADNSQGDLSLIGQFGVGFYSAFMLADRVEVVTRSYRETAGWRWESDGTGRFTVEPAEGETPRGAQIRLHLKEGLEEFLEPFRLKDVVRRYSTFVPFPVQRRRRTGQRAAADLGGTEIAGDRRAIRRLLSMAVASQHREAAVASASRRRFPAAISGDSVLPGDELRTARLRPDGARPASVRKRILVQSDNQDLLPEYLHFLYGLVDSADLPLNVSRETLQDHLVIPKLRKVLTKKVLDHLASLAEEKPADYRKFYDEFGSILRTGVASDFENREKVAALLRFHSTHGDDRDALVSLDDYLKRAAEGQTQIYYLTGLNRDSLSAHPRLEPFRRRNLEVLLLVDPVDEFALAQLHRYKEKELVSIDTADVKFPESTNPVETEAKTAPKNFPRVLELFRGALGDDVREVRESSQLGDAPCSLVNPQGGYSRLLQQVLRQQTNDYSVEKPILEVNPHASLIARLCELANNPDHDDFLRDCGRQLFANAQLLDGLNADPQATASRTLHFMEDLARGKSAIIV